MKRDQDNISRTMPARIWETILFVTMGFSLMMPCVLQAQDLGDALNTNLTWTTGATLGWYAETNVALDGLAAQSGGPVTTTQNSSIATTVTNSGYLLFSWKANLYGYLEWPNIHHGGRLDLYLNGAIDRTSYGTDWAPQFLYCNLAGTNTVQWVVSDENGYSTGQDVAWLDEPAFLPDPSGPQIWTQPQPPLQKVAAGKTVNISATAIGTPPLSYLWEKDGTSLPGATNATLTLTNVTLDQAGSYSVTVTNLYGSAISSNATLQVVPVLPLNKISQWPAYERSTTESVAVSGSRAYIGNEDVNTYGAFLVLDITDPANPTLLGKLEGTQHGFNHLRMVGNYVYAGLDSSGGLSVIDVSNPAQPQVVTNLNLGYISSLEIAGHYAYAVGSGLNIIDISQPAQPAVVGSVSPVCYPQAASVVGNYAYVVGRCSGNLAVVDISNPTNPVVLGTTGLFGPADKIAVTNNTAFIGTWNGLAVVDVSNPTNLVTVTNYSYGYTVRLAGNRAYVGSGNNLLVFDISTPANPVQIGSCNLYDYIENLDIEGNLVYVANWGNGLTVLDVSNPARPAVVGNYASGGNSLGVDVVGNLAFLADAQGGLQIFDLSLPAQPAPVGRYFTPSTIGPQQVKVVGNLAYLPYYGAGLRILDVSDPWHPVLKAAVTNINAQWVDVSGNYAYVGAGGDGLKILDVSDPANPVQIVQTNITVGVSLLKVVGNYLYLAPWYENNVMVVDISNPTQPIEVADNPFASQPWNLFIQGNRLFGGGQIADLSNPTNPVVVGQYNDQGYVECVSNIAFVADGYGLSAFDFSVPPTVQIGQTNLTGWSQAVTVAGQYAYVADDDWGLQVFQLPSSYITAPSVVPWPTNQTVFAGDNVTLAVNAVGQPPLTYQWYFNNTPVPNGTNWVLPFPNVQTAAAGNYSVVVANSAGTATNQTALSVIVRPSILVTGTNRFGFNTAGQFTFSFLSQTGAQYAVEYVNSLTDSNWITLTNARGNDLPVSVTDPHATNSSRYYRVRKE